MHCNVAKQPSKNKMTTYRLQAEQYFDGEHIYQNKVLTISNGKITAIDDETSTVDQVVSGLLTAGFIDLQVNGGGGVLFNTQPTIAGIKAIVNAYVPFGTTAMLPTFISDDIGNMERAAKATAQAIAEEVPGVLGIHFEGPHLSIAKKGTHSEAFIRTMSAREQAILTRSDMGKVVVTLAPENVSAETVAELVQQGVKICLGHTNADFETAQKAVDAGADGFTHLFNAMSPLQGRSPGVVGCALLNDKASAGIIIDGHHVDYISAKIALKTKPAGRLFLVTDGMPPVGTNQTEFEFFDRKVSLQDGKLTSTTGELAGSVLDMATAVRNSVQYLNVSLVEALRMASLYPANYIGQGNIRGKLVVGYAADMVLLDDQLQVCSTWIGGEQKYSAM